ncbi:MAG TPA: hypothetical protein VMG35_21075 [Bryobacteraceae bacterium]|nr:hypothetical protein [Bryobacteraceae bacterium]
MPLTPDRHRLAVAREELNECQHAVATGEYDTQTFNEAIATIQRVIDLNRLSGRNRSFLVDDVTALRDLQMRLAS